MIFKNETQARIYRVEVALGAGGSPGGFTGNDPSILDIDQKAVSSNTPPRFYIAPENGPSQKEIHLPTIDFQGLC